MIMSSSHRSAQGSSRGLSTPYMLPVPLSPTPSKDPKCGSIPLSPGELSVAGADVIYESTSGFGANPKNASIAVGEGPSAAGGSDIALPGHLCTFIRFSGASCCSSDGYGGKRGRPFKLPKSGADFRSDYLATTAGNGRSCTWGGTNGWRSPMSFRLPNPLTPRLCRVWKWRVRVRSRTAIRSGPLYPASCSSLVSFTTWRAGQRWMPWRRQARLRVVGQTPSY